MMNLREYFERIGYSGPFKKPDLETLNTIHRCHILSVPFENLSIHCGEKITMDLDTIFNKIVRRGRGGWCCENNLLFSWVLKELGYDTTMLGAKVFNSLTKEYSPTESHLINKVIIAGKPYIADVSFGVSCQIWEPLELISGKGQPQLPGLFQLVEHEGTWVLFKTGRKILIPNKSFVSSSLLDKALTKTIYCFTLAPRSIDHFLQTTEHLQTSPDSLFTNKSICSLQTDTGFRAVIGWTYSEVIYNYQEGHDLYEMSTIPDEEVEEVLKEKFGVALEHQLASVNNKLCLTL
nr:PREDICTED: arylamine N-acetyltransferase, pineal gland isozyme NAT-10-like [Lepisosteus oculatus]